MRTTAKKWKQLKCVSTHEKTRKIWYVFTMEYYPASENNVR